MIRCYPWFGHEMPNSFAICKKKHFQTWAQILRGIRASYPALPLEFWPAKPTSFGCFCNFDTGIGFYQAWCQCLLVSECASMNPTHPMAGLKRMKSLKEFWQFVGGGTQIPKNPFQTNWEKANVCLGLPGNRPRNKLCQPRSLRCHGCPRGRRARQGGTARLQEGGAAGRATGADTQSEKTPQRYRLGL